MVDKPGIALKPEKKKKKRDKTIQAGLKNKS